ncbi:MAG: Multidrug resistance protein MdtK [Turneriella sp.]|nr:Multidrug resistance protein MdtK [Turneriella sp.]
MFPESRTARWRTILSIAWPLIVANSFWNIQMTIDRLFLADYSTDAMGAAIAVMGVFWVPMALLQQTASYVTTFVAQYFGAKRDEMIGPAVWQSLYVGLIGGLLFLAFIAFAKPLFTFMGHPASTQILEVDYFVAMCFSALPTAFVATASGYFTGLGRTRVIMQINGVGLVANAILDYAMILGKWGFPKMGIAGAGYATAIATAMAAFYGLFLVFSDKKRREYRLASAYTWDTPLMKRFIRFGVPAGLQWALEGLAFSVFLIFVGRMASGDAALAASSIVVTIMMLAVLPAMGVAQASAVLLAQFLGEKKSDQAVRAVWAGWQVTLIYIVCIGATFLLFPQFYMNWFKNNDNATLWAQVSVMVPYLLVFVAIFTVSDSINLVFSFSLKGAGDTKFVTILALVLPWPLMVIPSFFLINLKGGLYWSWGAAAVFSITQAVIFWRRFVGGKWKNMSVIG